MKMRQKKQAFCTLSYNNAMEVAQSNTYGTQDFLHLRNMRCKKLTTHLKKRNSLQKQWQPIIISQRKLIYQ